MGKSKDSNTSVNGNNSNVEQRKAVTQTAPKSAPAQRKNGIAGGSVAPGVKTVATSKAAGSVSPSSGSRTPVGGNSAAGSAAVAQTAGNRTSASVVGKKIVTPDGRTVIVKAKQQVGGANAADRKSVV